MRSTDARWYLAVEALARMPELALRLVEVHHADEKGYCRGCMAPGGTLFVRWPCGLHGLATAATAPAVSSRGSADRRPGSDATGRPGREPSHGAGPDGAAGTTPGPHTEPSP